MKNSIGNLVFKRFFKSYVYVNIYKIIHGNFKKFAECHKIGKMFVMYVCTQNQVVDIGNIRKQFKF